jgi:hypothetical protein
MSLPSWLSRQSERSSQGLRTSRPWVSSFPITDGSRYLASLSPEARAMATRDGTVLVFVGLGSLCDALVERGQGPSRNYSIDPRRWRS